MNRGRRLNWIIKRGEGGGRCKCDVPDLGFNRFLIELNREVRRHRRCREESCLVWLRSNWVLINDILSRYIILTRVILHFIAYIQNTSLMSLNTFATNALTNLELRFSSINILKKKRRENFFLPPFFNVLPILHINLKLVMPFIVKYFLWYRWCFFFQ